MLSSRASAAWNVLVAIVGASEWETERERESLVSERTYTHAHTLGTSIITFVT